MTERVEGIRPRGRPRLRIEGTKWREIVEAVTVLNEHL